VERLVESLGNLAWWSFTDLLYLFRFLKSFFYMILGLNKKMELALKKESIFKSVGRIRQLHDLG
jgi:hypothetical protein